MSNYLENLKKKVEELKQKDLTQIQPHEVEAFKNTLFEITNEVLTELSNQLEKNEKDIANN